MIRKAAIDIGTNTTRLLIADLSQNGAFNKIFSRRIITRLGEGLAHHMLLNKTAMQRTLDAIKIYSYDIKKYRCSKVRAVATNAVREADNGEEFTQTIKNETGLHIEIISQEEEARFTTLGVFSGFKKKLKKTIIFDVGGGSTEYILTNHHSRPVRIVGTNLGIVSLTEKYIKSDPVNQMELQSLRKEVNKKLTVVKQKLGHVRNFTLIGTAGTPTQFAALDLDLFPYDPAAVNEHRMNFSTIEKIFTELSSKNIIERKAIRAMEHGREDLIIAGGVILLESLKLFNKKEVTISDFGLREGVLLS